MSEPKAAASVTLGYCANCELLHLWLRDDDGKVFAYATIDDSNGPALIDALQRGLYERAVSRT